ncbi:MAG: hypothetical protein LIR50_00885, partial [Bacillota bacterium]|nr:hypothetical protein [Bacillota bacterium]
WKSFNPALGELNGIFIIVQDSIMSKYISKDEQYNGFEYLKKVDDVTYENRGAAFKKEEKLSSWAVKLERIENDLGNYAKFDNDGVRKVNSDLGNVIKLIKA